MGKRLALTLVLSCMPASAGGPIETSVFAVQGVDVDVTSTDATAARNQALMDVQVKAFYQLLERLGTPELAADAQAKLTPEEIAPYLRSLSIEKETSAPGRYIGTFTVRFLPNKMQKYFADRGVHVPTRQAEPILILPVWRGADANQMWEDNIWRQAWLDLKGEQGIVPLIVPLGDLEDTETLTVEDALHDDPIKLEAIRKRYGAAYIRPREAYMTQVYNYYAFPPTLPGFCDAALAMARESMTLKPAELTVFAARYVPLFDVVYENFYRSYDQYRADAAAWDAKYAPVTVQVVVPQPTIVPPPTTTPAAPGR